MVTLINIPYYRTLVVLESPLSTGYDRYLNAPFAHSSNRRVRHINPNLLLKLLFESKHLSLHRRHLHALVAIDIS